jgi:hypothetical protein
VSVGVSAPDIPTPRGNERPNGFNETERPRALQKTIDGAEDTGPREREDEPATALLERIAHQHRRHGEEPEECETIHALRLSPPAERRECRRRKTTARVQIGRAVFDPQAAAAHTGFDRAAHPLGTRNELIEFLKFSFR